jgi:type IV pilus assembly protein PilB
MISEEQIKKILVTNGLVDVATFEAAVEQAKRSHRPLEEYVVDQGLIDDLKLGVLVADSYGIPFVNLREKILDSSVVRKIPEALARHKRLVLYDLREGKGYLATAAQQDPETINAISRSIEMPLEVAFTTERAISEALRYYQRGLDEEFAEMLRKDVQEAGKKGDNVTTEEVPIIRIVDTIIKYAYQSQASDIHFEPFDKEVAVRFRVDGVLQDVVPISKEVYKLIVARVKVLAKLRTDEHFAAQDGKIRIDVSEEELDVRVSVLPTVYGEKIVMRLLSKKGSRYTLEDLGFSPGDYKRMREAIMRPHGMILSTGPTGSGKTTTLYAILKTLNTREVNITTIEDPVEYLMDGVNQVQINTQTNLTFADGLRSILRQDPDIVMVGEIRDDETAAIAVNAALTGHLVLSTLHTNDAATTLPRLLDMGVESFLVASSVNVAIGQRLVRRVCQQCLISVPFPDNQRELMSKMLPPNSVIQQEIKKRSRVFQGKGCPVCGGSGFKGRVGVYEILVMDEEIKKLVAEKISGEEIKKVARAKGMTTMLEDGAAKVFQGITTFDEVLRVTQD